VSQIGMRRPACSRQQRQQHDNFSHDILPKA
jgi:hypothetical protein